MPDHLAYVTATFKEVEKSEPEPENGEGEGTAQEKKRPFEDVKKGDWFYDAVYYCYDNGWFKGVSDTLFAPKETMTRAMFVTVLYRIAGEPEVTGENVFSDVAEGAWYTDAVIWAAETGVVNGYDDGSFGVNDPITREQIVTMLWRYLGKPEGDGDLSRYPDADKVSDWAVDAMRWAVSVGLIQGDDQGCLNPTDSARRCEVAQIMMNYDVK